jgi:hypothetical protein
VATSSVDPSWAGLDARGRVCHGIELGNAAVLVETDEVFDVLVALMSREPTV